MRNKSKVKHEEARLQSQHFWQEDHEKKADSTNRNKQTKLFKMPGTICQVSGVRALVITISVSTNS